jgi:hypothetical protein
VRLTRPFWKAVLIWRFTASRICPPC